MAILGFNNPKIFAGAYNLSGNLNQVAIDYTADMLDASVFGSATKANCAGLKSIALSAAGLMEAPATPGQDKTLFDNVSATVSIPVTIMPTNTPVEADRCFFFAAQQLSFNVLGTHGDLYKFNITGAGGTTGHPLIQGYVLEPATTARASSSNGTGSSNLGALSATQYLYAALHVVAVSTPTTLDVIIESDDNAGFTSATTRATFTQVTTAITSQYLTRVAGPITDTYWRAKWTIAGTSYTFAVVAGKATL